jgi:hypothetical protein
MSQDNNSLRITWSIFLALIAVALLASTGLLFIQAMANLDLAIKQGDPIWMIDSRLVLLAEIAFLVVVMFYLLFRSPWLLAVFLIVLVGLIYAFPPEKIPTFLINIDRLLKSLVVFVLALIAFALAAWTIITLTRRHLRLALTLIGVLLIVVIAVKTHLLQE